MASFGLTALEAFCARLADDPTTGPAWRDEPDPAVFAERMADAGRAAGYEFRAEEVAALLQTRWQAWRERFQT